MRVVILRGHSGAGKSSAAAELVKRLPEGKTSWICSADRYFIDLDGEYKFDFNKLQEAHKHCFASFVTAIDNRYDLIIVDNTNTRLVELSPYVAYANINMIFPQDTLEIIRLNCSLSLAEARNIHGVPRGSIENMKKRMEKIPSYWPLEKLIQTN